MLRIKTKYLINPAVYVLFIFFSGCQEKNSSPVIVRIGKSVLTVEDLYKSIPPEYADRISPEQNVNYVKQWIQTELLYREALRLKYDKEPYIQERLEKMKKDLLAAEVINRSSKHFSNSIDQSSITDYYNQNQNKFIRDKDMVIYLEIVVEDLKTAYLVKQNANLHNFSEYAEKYSKIPFSDTLNVTPVPVDDVPADLKNAIQATMPGNISNPVKSELGYHLLLIIEKLPKGSICREEEVREEILTILSAKKQKENVEKMISALRLKNDMEYNINLITGNNSDSVANNQ
jgi:parvulin-like peptidyl-prolyl isomerase